MSTRHLSRLRDRDTLGRRHDQVGRLCPRQRRQWGAVRRRTTGGDAEPRFARLAVTEPGLGM